jgi:hypothetical protein
MKTAPREFHPADTPRGRMIQLRNFLDVLPPSDFNMLDWGDECGSVACIGGWAEFLFLAPLADGYWPGRRDAAEIIGLSDFKADRLFFPIVEMACGSPAMSCRDPSLAVHVIDHYLNAGQIDWSVAGRTDG